MLSFGMLLHAGFLWVRCAGFTLQALLWLRSTSSRAQVRWLWPTGLVAAWHVGSPQTRDHARVPGTAGGLPEKPRLTF